ncbi:hypothetical protein RFI02_19535 [Acinetobacter sichuanensis]|uniref:hypothetical protein n=1 Tax=Acinetobacter sichuanensis TaxID=2136183 RepID=UPI0028101D6D|nr:hypothetical protein [Acinetobacter sichuanensis]MDQ9023292.1 hypothetical protein [Acinetobacter sichuanensis]
MNYLTLLWELLGKNASQLQTIIAAIGVSFGIFAALYAKKQLILAKTQREEGLKLTSYNLRLSILNKAHECKELIYENEHKHAEYLEHFTTLLSKFNLTLNDTIPEQKCTYAEYFDYPLSLLKHPKEVVEKMIKQISNQDSNIQSSDLEMYLHHITNTTASLYTASKGFDRRMQELNKILNSFH